MLLSSFSMIKMKKRKPHALIFLSNFKNPILKFKLEPIFEQIQKEFPNLTVELKWNQPMFIHEWNLYYRFLGCQEPHFHCS